MWVEKITSLRAASLGRQMESRRRVPGQSHCRIWTAVDSSLREAEEFRSLTKGAALVPKTSPLGFTLE